MLRGILSLVELLRSIVIHTYGEETSFLRFFFCYSSSYVFCTTAVRFSLWNQYRAWFLIAKHAHKCCHPEIFFVLFLYVQKVLFLSCCPLNVFILLFRFQSEKVIVERIGRKRKIQQLDEKLKKNELNCTEKITIITLKKKNKFKKIYI